MRQAILIRAKGDGDHLPSKTDIAEYFLGKGFDVKTSILNLDDPHEVVQVCGAIVKFASGGWNGENRMSVLGYPRGENGEEKQEYSGIREWWKKEGSAKAKKMMADMWHPPEKEKPAP